METHTSTRTRLYHAYNEGSNSFRSWPHIVRIFSWPAQAAEVLSGEVNGVVYLRTTP